MSPALVILGSIVFLAWVIASDRSSKRRTENVYRTCFTAEQLDQVGRNLDGTEKA